MLLTTKKKQLKPVKKINNLSNKKIFGLENTDFVVDIMAALFITKLLFLLLI